MYVGFVNSKDKPVSFLSKWKPCKQTKNAETSFYLVKIEAFSIYWNPKYKPIDWDLPSQYYNWRNSMSNSLKNYSLNDENFDFCTFKNDE